MYSFSERMHHRVHAFWAGEYILSGTVSATPATNAVYLGPLCMWQRSATRMDA